MLDILKNPVIIGLFAGVITYIYLCWCLKEDNKKRKNKNKRTKKDVNLIIPSVIAIIIWFIAYGYFEYNTNESYPREMAIEQSSGIPKTYKLVKDSSSDVASFSLLNRGISVPNKPLPDVFIETYN
jgi:dipeptide/tripeptide permease